MKDESGFKDLPKWVKEWFVLALIVCVALGGLAWHLAKSDSDTWSAVGDLSGWASALVSAFGFIFIYYQLRQHHEDAKDAENRHNQILEQNLKLSLFEKRYSLYKFALNHSLIVENGKEAITFESIEILNWHANASKFLFPNGVDIQRWFFELRDLSRLYLEATKAHLPIAYLTEDESRRIEEIKIQIKDHFFTGKQLFEPHLYLNSPIAGVSPQ